MCMDAGISTEHGLATWPSPLSLHCTPHIYLYGIDQSNLEPLIEDGENIIELSNLSPPPNYFYDKITQFAPRKRTDFYIQQDRNISSYKLSLFGPVHMHFIFRYFLNRSTQLSTSKFGLFMVINPISDNTSQSRWHLWFSALSGLDLVREC